MSHAQEIDDLKHDLERYMKIAATCVNQCEKLRDALVKLAVYYDKEQGAMRCHLCKASTWSGLNVPHKEDCLLCVSK